MASRRYKIAPQDFRRFHDAIKEGPTSFYLRGHLLLERILLYAVKATVEHPDKLQKTSIKMGTLIDLVAALGLISDGMVAVLRYVDSVRNNLAHSLDFELTGAVPTRLTELLNAIGIVPNRTSTWEEELEICLLIAYVMLDGEVKRGLKIWPTKSHSGLRKPSMKKKPSTKKKPSVKKTRKAMRR